MTRLFLLALGLSLAACEPPPSVAYVTRAADPSAKTPPPVVADATEGTRNFVPAEAGDWDAINRAVAPHGGQK